jgi:hypothetical protein
MSGLLWDGYLYLSSVYPDSELVADIGRLQVNIPAVRRSQSEKDFQGCDPMSMAAQPDVIPGYVDECDWQCTKF